MHGLHERRRFDAVTPVSVVAAKSLPAALIPILKHVADVSSRQAAAHDYGDLASGIPP